MWLGFVLLSTLAWSLVNVFNSVLVHHYVKHPITLTWIQSFCSVPLLLLSLLFFDVSSSWIPVLILFGITGYAADLWFFYVLRHVDVSVMNLAWSFLSILLGLSGFLYFSESWTYLQSIGAILIISGAVLLSVYHQQLNAKRTLLFLVSLGLVYLPYYFVKKLALDAGESVGAVFFWMLIGRECVSISLPLLVPSARKGAVAAIRSGWVFPFLSFLVVALYFVAEYWGAIAYKTGPLSLVAVVSNLQPFIVMAFAWLCVVFWPGKAPRELITRQAISLKMICFTIVFLGLALLATSS